MRTGNIAFAAGLACITVATAATLILLGNPRDVARGETSAPPAATPAAAVTAPAGAAESAESARDATEIEQLERDLAALRRTVEEREADAAAKARRLAPESLAASPRPGNPWTNAGRATPYQTFQTVQWAILAGDVEALERSISFDADAAASARAFFDELDAASRSEFGSPERLVAAAVTGKAHELPIAADVVSETSAGADLVHVRMRIAGAKAQAREITLSFRSYPDGWRLQIPAKIVASYRNLLLGPVVDPRTYRVVR